jgi:hypothetical protein
MAVRIVHFGSDTFNRAAALKSRGYSVEECNSLAHLHAALVGIVPADAVVIADNEGNDGTVQAHALSLIRAISSVPLILFRNEDHHHGRADFDLVVPADAQADKWLAEIAELIARSSQRNF